MTAYLILNVFSIPVAGPGAAAGKSNFRRFFRARAHIFKIASKKRLMVKWRIPDVKN
jgi:hypothetical protein